MYHDNCEDVRQAILARIAEQKGKPVSELVRWQDYDPISIDDAVWAAQRRRAGSTDNWTGD